MAESVKANDDSDLWSRAYQQLDDKAERWISNISKKASGEEKTQDIITLVRNREEEYKDGTPKIRIGDSEIKWRDHANRVVMWVTAIGDISISFAPAGSPFVWSALKVLLKANVSQWEDLAAIFGCADKVLRLVKHGKVYEEIYLSGDFCNAATQNLQDALVNLYKALMELLTYASARLNEERKVSMAVQGCGAVASQEHQKLLRNLDEPMRNVEDAVKKLLQKVKDGEVEQALEYISTIPIGEHQQEKHEARTPGTCEWLLNHSIFIEWERSSCSSTLWLQGNVLDALDECEMDAREALVRILHNLIHKGDGTVKVFIASRKETDIEEYLGPRNLVEISAADNKEDIEKYVEEEVTKVSSIWRSVSAEVKEQVKKTIGEKSDGMFRWAYLQWEELKKLRTNQRICERLGKLPKGLTEAYEEIYSKNEEKIILERAVKWVLCARRPLRSEELLTAIRLESTLESLTVSDPIDGSTLESICSHLVVLDSQLKVWKFPHASVAEYFENQHRNWIDKAAEDVAILLVFLLIDCYSNWTLPQLDDEIREFLKKRPRLENYLDPRHPLQKYARRYWLQHVQSAPDQCQDVTGLSEILKRFLGDEGPQQSSSRQYQAWCRHIGIADELRYYHDIRDLRSSEKSIFGICVFDLHKLLAGWWDKDIDISQVNSRGLDLLAIAASYGHVELCSELISRGSDIHKELDSHHGSAFMEAIAKSKVKTVMLLLEKGVNPNLIRKGKSPLCLAVMRAVDLVELLLEAGADPNVICPNCAFVCGLEAAAYHDKTKAAELLIQYGANVNLITENNEYGSPLGAVAYQGSLECAKLFIENGADMNAHLGGQFGSVLAAAIFGFGGVQMVRYLVEDAGADPVVLFLSPPPRSPQVSDYGRTKRQETAKYLIEERHFHEGVLLNIGFPEEDLLAMEK
ncbi:hypothetical protein Trihar35433_9271 [Trichoderma harzianum]|nr:hypothetical protein Trihar35433_9271 [Trichoderma harzianum]